MKKITMILLFAAFWTASGQAQEYFPLSEGVKNESNHYTAFTNATIYQSPQIIISGGTLLIHKGKVVACGKTVTIPASTIVYDMKGKFIYPSFIDPFSTFGIKAPAARTGPRSSQYEPTREGYYWNDHVRPERNAVSEFEYDAKSAKDLIAVGFGTVASRVADGVLQGTGLLVTLDPTSDNNSRILDQRVAQFLAFQRSGLSAQAYPTSIMGYIALIRQLYYDAKWYDSGSSETRDLSIEALLANVKLPQIFDASDKLNILRADKIGDEFGINYIIKGNGREFEAIDDIKKTSSRLIIPLNFPKAYDVSDPYIAEALSLEDMRFWNQAPVNAARLEEAKIPFAFTATDSEKPKDFFDNLKKAISYGLSEEKALEALTTAPASFLRKEAMIGSLNVGTYANFLISSGPIFKDETILYENWIQGNRTVLQDMKSADLEGKFNLKVDTTSYSLTLSGKAPNLTSKLERDSTKMFSKVTYVEGWLNILFSGTGADSTGYSRLYGQVTYPDSLFGQGVLGDGKSISWVAIKSDTTKAKTKADSTKVTPEVFAITFPNKAYGYTKIPEQEKVLFKNATVWTNESEGIVENTDVLVVKGKISAVGKNLSASDARIVDGTGKHLTSGIIDEHTHIAATSINESGHNSSAEVRMADAINPDDVNIFRNLSGGVTVAQILHGSANPIGGQSAIIKLKWGHNAEELLANPQPKFIKFALGENVKQSNSQSQIRFPQSRMGVEQVFVDYFQRAKEYKAEWNAYNKLPVAQKANQKAPRFDLEMETLAEILEEKRFISCHSYVQSEINMLMKVAENFDFKVNTFTHILEGYKVADKMKAHGVGGSTFSDWWGYKYEVNDAIPHNAAIMHDAGVVVAINSDDAEMSRRLNQEAGKTVKYGGVSEEEAWKFVTLNPAKLLHLSDQIGSVKVGKDADLVLWSDNPLSIYAVAEKTMVDGTIYYDKDLLPEMVESIQKERNQLINLLLAEKNQGKATQPVRTRVEQEFHCETEDEH